LRLLHKIFGTVKDVLVNLSFVAQKSIAYLLRLRQFN